MMSKLFAKGRNSSQMAAGKVAAICSILLHLRNSYFRNIIIVSCLNRRLYHKWTEFLISDFFYVALISLRDFANVCKRPRMVAVATS